MAFYTVKFDTIFVKQYLPLVREIFVDILAAN